MYSCQGRLRRFSKRVFIEREVGRATAPLVQIHCDFELIEMHDAIDVVYIFGEQRLRD